MESSNPHILNHRKSDSYSLLDWLVIVTIGLILLNNVEHLAWAYRQLSQRWISAEWLNNTQAIAAVLVFELMVFVLTLKGVEAWAMAMAAAIGVLNLIYNDAYGHWQRGEWTLLISAVIFSTVYAAGIAAFSKYFAARYSLADNTSNMEAELSNRAATISKLRQQVTTGEAMLEDARAQLKEARANAKEAQTIAHDATRQLAAYKEARTCPYCGEEQASELALRTHKGHCGAKKQ